MHFDTESVFLNHMRAVNIKKSFHLWLIVKGVMIID